MFAQDCVGRVFDLAEDGFTACLRPPFCRLRFWLDIDRLVNVFHVLI